MKYVPWWRSRLIPAPKMTIKSHFPWWVKIVFVLVVLGLGALIAFWAYELGRSLPGKNPAASPEQVRMLKEQVGQLTSERDQLSNTANTTNTAQSMLDMARAAQAQLAAQLTALEAENVRLKEDLLFFESLLPANTGAGGLAIRRLKVELVNPGQLRYRILVMQGGKAGAAFSGSLQLVLTALQNGKTINLTFPNDNLPVVEREQYALGFKHYQRLEGVVNVPQGMTVQSMQARILEKGKIRAQQSVNL